MRTKIPLELHRYLNCDGALNTLRTKRLRFSPIDMYNDPFELIPAASSDIFRYTPTELQRKIMEIAKTEEGKKKIKELEESIGAGDVIAGITLAAGAITFPWLAAIVGAGLFLAALADETKEIKLLATKYFPIFQSVRCCCFSQQYDNILLWSNYADAHKGVVLSFDTFVSYWRGDEFRKMEYSNKRAGLPTEDCDPNEYVWKMLTQKSLDWKYEQEYRMIKFDKNHHRYYDYKLNAKALKAIRLGLDVAPDVRKEIIELRNHLYKDTVIYQAKFNRSEYKLDFEEL